MKENTFSEMLLFTFKLLNEKLKKILVYNFIYLRNMILITELIVQ